MITQQSISSISDLRFKTKDVFAKAGKEPVFLFHHSTPKGVLLSMEQYEEMMSALEDYYLSTKAESFEKDDKSKISWKSHVEVKKMLGYV